MAKSSPRTHLGKALAALEAAPDALTALDAARRVRESAERVETEHVRAARAEGASWSRIGALYGLTKQGAQQRFGQLVRPSGSSAPEPDRPS